MEAHSKLFKKYQKSNAELIGPPNAYAFCMIRQRINNVASTNNQEVVGRKVTQGFNRMVSRLYPCQQPSEAFELSAVCGSKQKTCLMLCLNKYRSDTEINPLFLASSFRRLSAVVPLSINKLLLTNKLYFATSWSRQHDLSSGNIYNLKGFLPKSSSASVSRAPLYSKLLCIGKYNRDI